MELDNATKTHQLPLSFDHCDLCVAEMEIKYGYKCCPLGFNPYINHPNLNEAHCKRGETKD